jgi:hypothetical protein
MATIAPPAPAQQGFPLNDVTKALVDELLLIAKDEAQVRGITLPGDRPGMMAAAIPMDSLTVVATLVAVEKHLGFELKESIVRTGGYDSVQAAIDHLVPRIQVAWGMHKVKKP